MPCPPSPGDSSSSSSSEPPSSEWCGRYSRSWSGRDSQRGEPLTWCQSRSWRFVWTLILILYGKMGSISFTRRWTTFSRRRRRSKYDVGYFEKYPLSPWKPFPILQYTWLDFLSDMRTSSSFIFQSVSLRRRLGTYCSSFFRWITLSLLPLPPTPPHYMEEKKGGREACMYGEFEGVFAMRNGDKYKMKKYIE